VDDIILAAPNDKIDLILESFNNYHERLKFTVELEKDRSLSFLDLLITISNNIHRLVPQRYFFWKISVLLL